MENFKTILYEPQKLGIKLLEKGKYVNVKHRVSSLPYKVKGKFFCKKALHGATNVLDEIYGEIFYMGTNDQIMQGGKLMDQRFQRSSQVIFPLIDPDLCYIYII